FLKLRAVCVLAAVPFVCVFLTVPAFQFVFAKLNLAFNGNAVLFVYRLPCIDRVYPVIHFVTSFLKKNRSSLQFYYTASIPANQRWLRDLCPGFLFLPLIGIFAEHLIKLLLQFPAFGRFLLRREHRGEVFQ